MARVGVVGVTLPPNDILLGRTRRSAAAAGTGARARVGAGAEVGAGVGAKTGLVSSCSSRAGGQSYRQ